MPVNTRSHSRIEVLFPIVLFLIFTLSALIVILFAARIYQGTIEDGNAQYRENIAFSYLTQKIHQTDTNGSVSVGTLDGNQALLLNETYEGMPYTTYIYAYDGKIRELFIAADESVSSLVPGSGMEIFEAKSMDVSMLYNNLLSITITDENDHAKNIRVALRSHPSAFTVIEDTIHADMNGDGVVDELDEGYDNKRLNRSGNTLTDTGRSDTNDGSGSNGSSNSNGNPGSGNTNHGIQKNSDGQEVNIDEFIRTVPDIWEVN